MPVNENGQIVKQGAQDITLRNVLQKQSGEFAKALASFE